MSANVAVTLALSLLAATPAKQLPRSRTDLREASVTTATLDNGLEVVVFEAHASPLVSVWTWYRSGSRDERPGATGITHLLEHMTFEGTEELTADKMAASVAGVAGEWNGYTFLDSTAYFETVPRESLGAVLHLEAQRMGHATLPADRLEAVRTTVVGELSGSDASPADQLDRAVAGAAFQAHPYHWATVGYATDLAAVTRDSLLDWYHARYLPSNATLVIVGDVKASEAIETARKELGALPKASPPPPVTTVEPPQDGERRIVLARGSGARLLEIAWRAPAAGDPDFPAYLVADAILGGAKGTNLWTLPDAPASRSSRLGSALLASKLASDARTYLFPTRDPYLESLRVTVAPDSDPGKIEAATIAAAEQLAAEVTEADVARARRQLAARLVFEAEGDTEIAHQLGLFSVVAPDASSWRTLFRLPDAVGAVTLADVKRVASRYWTPAGRTVGWLLPPGDAKHAETASPPRDVLAGVPNAFAAHGTGSAAAIVELAAGAPELAAPSASAGAPPPTRVTRQQLPNGMVLLALKNPAAPVVALSVDIAAGATVEPAEKAGIACLVARLLTSGNATRTESQITQAFEGAGATLSLSCDRERVRLEVQSLSSDLAALLPVLRDVIAAPAFPKDSYDREKAAALAEAEGRDSDPAAALEDQLRLSLFPASDPRARPAGGTPATIPVISRADLGAFQRNWYRPDAVTISVAGDLEPAEAFRLLSKAFRDWKASGPKPVVSAPAASPSPAGSPAGSPPAASPSPSPSVAKVLIPSAKKSLVGLALPGLSPSDKDWPALRTLTALLAEAPPPRIAKALGGQASWWRISLDDELLFLRAGGIDPAHASDALSALKGAVQKAGGDTFAADETGSASSWVAGHLARSLEHDQGLASYDADLERYKLGLDQPKHYLHALQTLTADDLTRAAKAHLAADPVTGVAGPKP